MSNTIFAHGATGSVGVQGYATGAAIPTTWVTLAVKSWKGTYTKAVHDTSNTSVPGFTVAQPGKATLKFTIEAELPLASAGLSYDQTHNPISSAGPDLQADYCSINLVGGTTPAGSVTTANNNVANLVFHADSAVIDSFEITNVENDVIKYTLSGQSSGTFTINGGS